MVPRRNSHRLTFRPLAGRGLDLDLRSLSIVIVGTGVVLRFVQLIAQRPLWLDEVWMALNIVTRPFGGALQTLDAGQNAPVLFLWSERVAVLVGGSTELALRFVPFVIGAATVYVMWRLADRLLDRGSVPLAVVLTAVSPLLIRYSNEVKPYILDAFFAATLLILTLQLVESGSNRAWRRWAICGAIAVAGSLAAPFTLVTVALVVLLRRWSEDGLECLLRISASAVVWLALFATQYALQYHHSATDGFMQVAWSGSFLDLSFPEFFRTAGMAIRGLWLATVLGNDIEVFLPPKSTSVVIVISLVGLVSLVRRNPMAVAMLTGPGVVAAVASMLQRWPLADRLLLFAAPSVILLTAAGVGQLARMTPPKARAASTLGIGGLLLAFPTFGAIQRTLEPPTIADVPAAIAELELRLAEGEPVYVFAKAHVECSFYTGDLETPNPTCTFPNARVLAGRWGPESSAINPDEGIANSRTDWAEEEALRILATAESRFWLLSSEDSWRTESVGSALARNGAVLEERHEWEGSRLILYRVQS